VEPSVIFLGFLKEGALKIFVPGRVCLFGEHSDWAGGYRRINSKIEKGYTLLTGTDQGIYAEVAAHPASLMLSSTTPSGERCHYEIPMDRPTLLAEAQRGGFWSYVAGVAYQVMTNYDVRGLVIDNYRTDLPMKKGLSSSAAICVLTARAFNRVYDLKLTTRGEMELAYLGEITTPSRCGRMDQGCAFGNRPVLMTYDGDRMEVAELTISEDLYLVLVDLGAQKNTQEILARLNHCFPFAETEIEQGVQQLLGPMNRDTVHKAIEALQQSDARRIGELMTSAQADFDSYAAPACPEELNAPVLHRVLSHTPLQSHVWGGKGVGSQGDGTAQFIARSAADQRRVIEILERELGMKCLPVTLRAGQRVRKAVIPAAGFGTRLFPASKATKKELFPVIDRDGIAKPAILYLVEEALGAGIEQVIIIVQQHDLEDFQTFFSEQISIENYNKLPRRFQEYASRILEMGRRVTFAVQEAQEGFGHAVYSAHDKVGREPFLLMLGDHLYRSQTATSCAQQLIDAYMQCRTSIVGLRRTPEQQLANFGAATGLWLQQDHLVSITEFAEKPTIDYARNYLRVEGLGEGEYLTVFGQYIIKPQVFEYLEENIKNNVREHGEFQLTSALDRMRQEDGFTGLIMQGQRYDIGIPQYYLDTLKGFSEA
jgi:UTP-glucose-1-phosphate uridylyltransferase/mevalonate kinase